MIIRILLIIILFPLLIKADDSLNDTINKILAENIDITRQLNIAIQVKDLKTKEEIYSLNPYRIMIPASTTKSFTAYAALKYLGPEFTYSTQILFDLSKIDSNGILSGDLYIKFSGDPSLTAKDFSRIMSELKKYNINGITGDVIVDDSIFDQYYQADGWPWDDSKFCFAAPTSAIVVDKNCFYLNLSPAKSIEKTSILTGVSVAQVENNIVTENNLNCSPELKAYQDNRYNLTGCLNIKSPTIPLKIAYQDPRLMITELIKDFFPQQRIVFGITPVEYKAIIEHRSAPLAELVKYMHKNSDNITADNLTKTIGAYYYKTQGSFLNGTKAIGEIIGNKDIKIFDGSGGSRYNLISPNQLVDLYMLGYQNQIFYDSLPIAGIDGSFETKFANLNGKIHAKTGSMSGVMCLVGYLNKDNGQILVFSIMINSSTNKKSTQDLIERILFAISNASFKAIE